MENPKFFYADIVGQTQLVARLRAFTEFSRSTGGTPGHVLLIGAEGMGLSTIAMALANEANVDFQRLDAADMEVGDLTPVVTNLKDNQILLLSNVQHLRRIHVSNLAQVLREGKLEITIGQGKATRRHVMDLKPFTLVATCLKRSDCPEELLGEFSLVLNLQPYSTEELRTLAARIAVGAGLSLQVGAAELIASCCDGRPKHLESTLLRLARAINKSVITEADTIKAFAVFGILVGPDGKMGGPNSIQSLSGQDFERLITTLLSRMGFQTEMTQTTGDGGIDIIALLDKPIYGGRYLFQCKRFAPENLVGAPTVRDFYGAVMADRAVKGIFVTTSDFTLQAREFGERAGVELINHKQLQKLLFEYRLAELQDG